MYYVTVCMYGMQLARDPAVVEAATDLALKVFAAKEVNHVRKQALPSPPALT